MSLFVARIVCLAGLLGWGSELLAADPSPLEKQQEAISLMRVKGQQLYLSEVDGETCCSLCLKQPSDREINALPYLPAVTQLEIQGCKLSPENVQQIAQLNRIEKLIVERCEFPRESLAFLKHLTSLEKLYLRHCKFDGASLSELGSLDALYYVRLEDCDLEDTGYLVLPTEMEHLQRVFVYDTFVNRWSFRRLLASSYLTSLRFRDPKITDDFLDDVTPGENLRYIRIADSISEKAVRKFRRRFPKVNLFH
ncbi:hypothetical protein GC197_12555 [bacterium]|nr:hypothetical protein [bacterium]